MEEFGGGIGKWGALGEMRRAAVEEHHRDQGQGRGALHIAKGPDGTKGFRVQALNDGDLRYGDKR